MESEMVCLTGEPAICAVMSYPSRPTAPSGFVDEDGPLLENAHLLELLKADNPPGGRLCLFDELEEED
jgi:hypothetical protein